MKKLFLAVLAALTASALPLSAQQEEAYSGGIKGVVVNRSERTPVENARISVSSGTAASYEVEVSQDGTFTLSNLPDGLYTLRITAPGYLDNLVTTTVHDGYVNNLFNLSLSEVQRVDEIDDDNFALYDLDNAGYSDNPTILFGSNDVFDNIAGYGFASVRFRARGYNSEIQDVYIAGVRMNDAITGYSPYALWSGLNEAMRDKETVSGSDFSDYGLGAYNGLTNIFGTASHVRKGFRTSVLTNSALYRLRVTATYSTGMMDNGWALAASVSSRLGGNHWIDGVYYRSLAYYVAADKRFNDEHTLSIAAFGAPGERGVQNASTQEVYDLVGNNMYNSNWGYQAGKVRNARVRRVHEPVVFLKHDWKPSDKYSQSATILARFGSNGYTALDWFDAQDPRPDYYRNLPSYFMDPNPDLNRNNDMKWGWANEVWTHPSSYSDLTQINWDRLYRVNATQADGRAKYVQEERHTDQRELNFALTGRLRPGGFFKANFGVFARLNYTHFYKKLADLLGGGYFKDVDNFAERDFGSMEWKVQNDLDYYIANGEARNLHTGDSYGYDYAAQTRYVGHWWDTEFTFGALKLNAGAMLSYDTYWRVGYKRKGLFPGLDDNGNKLVVDGTVLEPTYEPDGSVVTSKGKSDYLHFWSWSVKGAASYTIGTHMKVSGHVGYYTAAPKFNQVFLSPRTRNSLVDGIDKVKTFASDLNWEYSGNGINARFTAFYTTIKDQSKVMSAFDDLQNTFSNFAITNIDQRNMGIELGFRVPTYFVPNLSVQGALALGEYVYTSTPLLTQTVDNSSEVIMRDVPLPYWKHTILTDGTVVQKHYVPTTPQTALSIGLAYNYNYWFIDADFQYFDRAYLDMSPLYRTDAAVAGPDNRVTDEELVYMTTQEKFPRAFLLNLSVGKSWFTKDRHQIGFSLSAKNLLNNKNVRTGGYEQTRFIDNTVAKERYYRFDPKYFYMAGFNYMINVYFRF
ncbi:MAG: DUF2012 domain-containing protein [Bacteroidales bacterium]|nr:DUF2012 domain-containing protein [Bacteroidales bacterium]